MFIFKHLSLKALSALQENNMEEEEGQGNKNS